MFLAIAAASVFCVESIAQTADEFFMLGNNAYKNGDYARWPEVERWKTRAGGTACRALPCGEK